MGREVSLHIVETVRDSSSQGGPSGSIGMLFVVLIIIIILGLMAGVLARICGGRHFAGLGEYDFEGWVEHKCASCLDGSMPPALPAALPPPPSQEGPKLLEQSKPDQEKKGDSAEEKQETVPT